MMGSDWPVCVLATTYARWFEVVQTLVGQLSAGEQQRIGGGRHRRSIAWAGSG